MIKVLRTGQGMEHSKCSVFVKPMRKCGHTATYCHAYHYYCHSIPRAFHSFQKAQHQKNAKGGWPQDHPSTFLLDMKI